MQEMKEKNKNGFSLIEVMVAVLLLVVMVVAGAYAMSQAGGGIQRRQNMREAVISANSVLEEYWNLNYDGIVSLAGTTVTRSAVVNGITMNVAITFGNEVNITGATENQQYVEVKVDIDHLSSTDDIVFTTRRYKYGLSRAAL